MKLVASAIVRNEMGRYLEPWVEHVLSFCDELRVLDDGSSDGTEEFLESHERVEVMRNTGPRFFEHEGAARNLLLDWTMDAVPDYVLAIDADEFVAQPERLRATCEAGPAVVVLTMVEVWKASPEHLWMRVDGLWGPRECPICWRAPPSSQRRGTRWRIPNRKLSCGREPLAAKRAHPKVRNGEILHFGWTRASERGVRAERYFENDGGRFHSSKHLQSILYSNSRVRLSRARWPQALDSTVLWERASL